jgi:hypothetical protein
MGQVTEKDDVVAGEGNVARGLKISRSRYVPVRRNFAVFYVSSVSKNPNSGPTGRNSKWIEQPIQCLDVFERVSLKGYCPPRKIELYAMRFERCDADNSIDSSLDLLKLNDFTIEFETKKIIFHPTAPKTYVPPGDPLSDCLILEPQVQGHPIRLIVDTCPRAD